MEVQVATTDQDIVKCTEAILELRPHLAQTPLVPLVRQMMQEGYQLAFVEADGKAASVMGYRYQHFLFNGPHFYIDDLATLPAYRSKGYASLLLRHLEALARQLGYQQITLDSGHHRHAAHRLYLNHGYDIVAHHFIKKL